MILFLRNIPAQTRISDIAEFVTPALRGGWFKRRGTIIKTEILTLHDKRVNAYEFHGLVEIEPERAAQLAIKKLNGRSLNGKIITVREYRIRTWHNDPLDPRERLRNNRRRKELEIIEDQSTLFVGQKEFHRRGG